MQIKRNFKGYRVFNFIDFHGKSCLLKESSETREDCCVIEFNNNKIYLTKDNSKNIINLLQQFVESGKFHKED